MWGDTYRLNSFQWSKAAAVADLVAELDARSVQDGNRARSVRIFLKDSPVQALGCLAQEREFAFVDLEEAVAALRRGVVDTASAIEALDHFRLETAAKRRKDSHEWPPAAPAERCRQCIDCGGAASNHCHICGLALCTVPDKPMPRCLAEHPLTSGKDAPDTIKTCRRCADYARRQGIERSAERDLVALNFRNVLAATMDSPCLAYAFAGTKPGLEEADDCAGCGRSVYTGVQLMPGTLRHHCRACGRTLCAACLCGTVTCMARGICPHKGLLPQYDYEEAVKVCKDCLPYVKARDVAREVVEKLGKTGAKWADHCLRVVKYVEDPDTLPMYTQEWVDTSKDKFVRAGNMAVSGVKLLTPFLSLPVAVGVNAAHAAWNYGQYGLLGLFCTEEITQGIATLHNMSKELQNVEPKQLLVGLLYLGAEQRRHFRSAPESDHQEAMENGRPLDGELLELLIGLAGIGMHAPYEDKAVEAQRFALQQNWRLVTERLAESWKHQPAWCLYVHQARDHKVAAIAVRGTDVEKSLGGDLFTDINALPERMVGSDGVSVIAHSGMLASARKLEPELRQALRALVAFDYQIILVGHSLGAGVVALLVWLLKHGPDGQRLPESAQIFGVGYATPSCVDKKTSEAMQPYFTSVVNCVDVIPRLTLTSMKELTIEVAKCAHESKSDLNADMESIVDRVATVWAPKMRGHNAQQPAASVAAQAAAAAATAAAEGGATAVSEIATKVTAGGNAVGTFLKRISKHTLTSLELGPDVEATAAVPPKSLGGSASSTAPALGLDPDGPPPSDMPAGSTSEADRTFAQADPQTSLLQASEGSLLWVPGGSDSVKLAWYGDAKRPWQVKEGIGRMVTDEVKANILSNNMLGIFMSTFGDPCPRIRKKLFLLVDSAVGSEELFCPGVVVWIHRLHGSLRAATVPCDLKSLRRIRCDRRFVEDHSKLAYHRALLTVRARNLVEPKVKWQSFAEAGRICPCCHSKYDWQSSTESETQRWVWMTNCRACGQVVCTSCAQSRVALPELGIPDPCRVCDVCVWRGPDGGAALGKLTKIFANASSTSSASAASGGGQESDGS